MKLRQLKPAQRYRKSKSKGHRRAMWRRAHGKCWYCGKCIGKKDFILEHQEPFARGGADSSRNIVISCQPCDRMKGSMNVEEFRAHVATKMRAERPVAFYGEKLSGDVHPWRGTPT